MISPTGAFLATLAIVLLGLLLPGIPGGLILLVLAGVLVVMMRRTWAVATTGTRAFRLVVLLGLVVLAAVKIF